MPIDKNKCIHVSLVDGKCMCPDPKCAGAGNLCIGFDDGCHNYFPYSRTSNDMEFLKHMNDQTIKADAGKPRLTLVPQQIIFDIAKVREYGLKKYGTSESWHKVDIHRYRDATYRHFLAYLNDPKGVDEESGLSHLSHLATNIAFLCELEKEEKSND